MKAILKSDRKVIVDVLPKEGEYVDVNTGIIYFEDEIELLEYQGG